MNNIETAHQMYREGNYDNALRFYTEALSMAKTKPQKIALHSNRAACYLKLRHFKKSLELGAKKDSSSSTCLDTKRQWQSQDEYRAALECTWVLELDQNHTGALMLRAQTLVTLKDYQSALFDVNRLIELNPVSEVYQNLQARLKSQLVLCFAQGKSLAPIPEAEAEFEEEDKDRYEAKLKEEPRKDYIEENLEEDESEVDNCPAELGVEDAETCKERGKLGYLTDKYIGNEPLLNPQKDKLASSTSCSSAALSQAPNIGNSLDPKPLGWQTIAKPKGHSRLDYSRWDTVEDDSSEDEEDEDEDDCQPQYRFRVKNVGVHAVK